MESNVDGQEPVTWCLNPVKVLRNNNDGTWTVIFADDTEGETITGGSGGSGADGRVSYGIADGTTVDGQGNPIAPGTPVLNAYDGDGNYIGSKSCMDMFSQVKTPDGTLIPTDADGNQTITQCCVWSSIVDNDGNVTYPDGHPLAGDTVPAVDSNGDPIPPGTEVQSETDASGEYQVSCPKAGVVPCKFSKEMCDDSDTSFIAVVTIASDGTSSVEYFTLDTTLNAVAYTPVGEVKECTAGSALQPCIAIPLSAFVDPANKTQAEVDAWVAENGTGVIGQMYSCPGGYLYADNGDDTAKCLKAPSAGDPVEEECVIELGNLVAPCATEGDDPELADRGAVAVPLPAITDQNGVAYTGDIQVKFSADGVNFYDSGEVPAGTDLSGEAGSFLLPGSVLGDGGALIFDKLSWAVASGCYEADHTVGTPARDISTEAPKEVVMTICVKGQETEVILPTFYWYSWDNNTIGGLPANLATYDPDGDPALNFPVGADLGDVCYPVGGPYKWNFGAPPPFPISTNASPALGDCDNLVYRSIFGGNWNYNFGCNITDGGPEVSEVTYVKNGESITETLPAGTFMWDYMRTLLGVSADVVLQDGVNGTDKWQGWYQARSCLPNCKFGEFFDFVIEPYTSASGDHVAGTMTLKVPVHIGF